MERKAQYGPEGYNEPMKTTYYIYGILIIVIVALLFALNGKQASAPAATPSATSTPAAGVSPTASAPASQTPTVASRYPVHVKKGVLDVWYSSPTTTVASEIQINNPPQNAVASSPLTVSGLAKGTWYFEGSMPILLTDPTGKILARGSVRAQSDWMTDGKVPFLGTLVFPRQPTGSTGVFVIHNDNPSGSAANAKEVDILVTFE